MTAWILASALPMAFALTTQLPCPFPAPCLGYLRRAMDAAAFGSLERPNPSATLVHGVDSCAAPGCTGTRRTWTLRRPESSRGKDGSLALKLEFAASCEAGLESITIAFEHPHPRQPLIAERTREIAIRFPEGDTQCQRPAADVGFERPGSDQLARGGPTREQCRQSEPPGGIPADVHALFCRAVHGLVPIRPAPPPLPGPTVSSSPASSRVSPPTESAAPCLDRNYLDDQPLPPGNRRLLSRLTALLLTGDDRAYFDVIWSLHSPSDAPVLARISEKDPRPSMRWWAVRQLGQIARDSSAPQAREKLLGLGSAAWSNEEVANWVQEIGLSADNTSPLARAACVTRLETFLDHPASGVRTKAITGLLRVLAHAPGTPAARARLAAALRSVPALGEDDDGAEIGYQLRSLADKELAPETRAWLLEQATFLANQDGRTAFWGRATLDSLKSPSRSLNE